MASNKCNYCGAEIPSQGEFCPECGKRVVVSETTQVQQIPADYNQPMPGNENTVPAYAPLPPRGTDSNSKHKMLLGMALGAILVAVLVAVVLLIIHLGKKSHDEKPQDTSGPTVEIVEKQRSADMVYSTSSDGFVNVRESPSAHSRIVSVLYTGGDGATYLGMENNWYFVEHNGKRGYVNSRYASRSSATGAAPAPAHPGTTYFVVVGSYDRLDHAQKMADEFSGAVYRAVVEGTIKYRVCLNGDPSKESAKRKTISMPPMAKMPGFGHVKAPPSASIVQEIDHNPSEQIHFKSYPLLWHLPNVHSAITMFRTKQRYAPSAALF